MKGVGAIIVIMLTAALACAQQLPPRDFNLERLAEELFALQDEDLNYEDLYENLLQRLANPLDLNTASAEDLRSLLMLNERQISDLLALRNASPLLSVYELQVLPSYDAEIIQKLAPFVRISEQSTPSRALAGLLANPGNYWLVRYERTVETKQGYRANATTRYVGSPDKFYTRLRLATPGKYSIGVTTEKDAGEPIAWTRRQPGFDYHAAHVQIQGDRLVRNLILGDFQAQFGQGLVLGNGLGFGKGAETITAIRRSHLGFLPHTSVVESGFFRGAACTLQPTPTITAHLFGSRLWRDGHPEVDSLAGATVSSLLLSGLHRTGNEMASRKQVEEINAGGAVTFSRKALLTGLLLHHTRLGATLVRKPTPYNQFAFAGNTNTNASIFLNYASGNTSLFSEMAVTLHDGYGLVAGLLSSLSQHVDVSVHLRSYSRNYQPLYANALSEGTTPQNEQGVYWGWKYTPSKKIVAAGYVDLFRFPWLRYRAYTPNVEGNEWLLRLTYKPSKSITTYVQYREETKDRNVSEKTTFYKTAAGTKRNIWLHADFRTATLNWKSRIQYSRYVHSASTEGWAFIQEVSLPIRHFFALTARCVLFDTDDFDNRQYSYERDVWLAYSLPAYHGQGIRAYLLLHRALGPRTDIWFRWAHTTYRDRSTIGTGGEKINGNSRNDVKFQLRYRFTQ